MQRYLPDYKPENEADARVVSAAGTRYEQFRKLAAMAAEQPATRRYVESEMGRLLDQMTDTERRELRAALLAATPKRRTR